MIEESGHERRSKVKKAAILNATIEAIFQNGNLNIDAIAKAANVSKTTIYIYFGTKSNLVAEAMDQHVTQVLRSAEEILSQDAPFFDKLSRIFDVDIAEKKVTVMELLKSEDWRDIRLENHKNCIVTEKIHPFLLKIVRHGKADGMIDPNLSDSAVMAFIGSTIMHFKGIDLIDQDKNYKDSIVSLLRYGLQGPCCKPNE